MVNDFWLKNKHTISIFQAQVRDLAKHIEAQPKKHNAYKKKHVSTLTKICTNTKKNFGTKRKKQVISESLKIPTKVSFPFFSAELFNLYKACQLS